MKKLLVMVNMYTPFYAAVVGCGFIAEAHVKAWRNVGARVVAVCDRDVSIAKFKAEKWRVPRYYEDVSKMIKEEKLDVVSICTPVNVRLDVVKPFVENGVPVVVEKPFAMSVAESEKMIELKNKYETKLTVIHNWLFSHIMKRILRSLERKEVGELLGFEINMLHTKNELITANPSHWSHSLRAGCFGENLPHPLYISRALLGEVKISHISGSKLGSYQWMPIDELRLLLEDIKGRMASIYISFNSAQDEKTLKIFGTTDILEVNLSNNILIKKQFRKIKIKDVMMDNLCQIRDYITLTFLIGGSILTKRYKDMHTEFMKVFKKSLITDVDPPVLPEETLKVVKPHEHLCNEIHKLYFTK